MFQTPRRHLALAIAIALLLLPGCPTSAPADEAAPVADERYLAAWGPYRLTAGDLRDALRLRAATGALRMTTLRDRLLEVDDPTLQEAITEAIRQGYILHESRHVALPDDVAAVRDELAREHPGLVALVRNDLDEAREDTLRALDLDEDSAEDFLDRLTRARLWPGVPPRQLEEDALREAWRTANTSVRVAWAVIPNRYPGDIVDAFVRQRQDEIRVYHDQHASERFREPLRIRAHAIRFPAPADDPAQRAEARVRAELVRAEALQLEGDPDAFAELAEHHAYGEAHPNHGDLGWREPQHVPGIPPMQPGEVSPVVELADAFVVYLLRERRDAHVPPLDAALERRIAMQMLRERGPSPRATELVQQLQEEPLADVDAFLARAAELDLRTEQPPAFTVHPQGFIPMLGRAPELMADLFDPERAVPSLVLHNSPARIHVVYLLQRTRPDADGFEQDREAFEPEHREALRRRFLEQRLADLDERFRPVIDLDAVRETLQRDAARSAPLPPETEP
ncbi:MAG: hypothetical protein EA398_10305 [Deltaproteobacteria bacterium]|nr:MAG: hypothetical protein EA398_10305 [Deltaproteobacteria bacterium]